MNNYDQYNNFKNNISTLKGSINSHSNSPNIPNSKKLISSLGEYHGSGKFVNSYKFKDSSNSPIKSDEELTKSINSEIKRLQEKSNKVKLVLGDTGLSKLAGISNKNLVSMTNDSERDKENNRYLKNDSDNRIGKYTAKGRNLVHPLNNNSNMLSNSKKIEDTLHSNHNQQDRVSTNGNKNIRQVLIDRSSFSPVIGKLSLKKEYSNGKNDIPTSISNNIPIPLNKGINKRSDQKTPSFSIKLPNLYDKMNQNKENSEKSANRNGNKAISLTPNKLISNKSKINSQNVVEKDGKKTITPDFDRQILKREYSPVPENNFTGGLGNTGSGSESVKLRIKKQKKNVEENLMNNNLQASVGNSRVPTRTSINGENSEKIDNIHLVRKKNSGKVTNNKILIDSESPPHRQTKTNNTLNAMLKNNKENYQIGFSSSNNSSSTQYEDKTKIRKNLIKSFQYKSQAGKNENGLTKINQDSYVVANNVLGIEEYNIFGVLDGHGNNGHLASNAISNFLVEYFKKKSNYISKKSTLSDANIVNIGSASPKGNKTKSLSYSQKDFDGANMKEDQVYEKLRENNYEIIKSAFFQAEIELTHAKFDVNFSGSTGNLVILLGDKIICANAGDSRAIVVSENKRGGFNPTKIRSSVFNYDYLNFEVQNLSIDHKPEMEHEKKRIISSGGRVDKYIENGVRSGPYRVWLKNENYPGLAMSRSIGDLIAGSVGVICEPEIIEHEITENTKYIVIASDGIWEFLDNQRVMNIVNSYYTRNDPESACNALIREATDWWEKEDCVVDDITAIVIFLNCK